MIASALVDKPARTITLMAIPWRPAPSVSIKLLFERSRHRPAVCWNRADAAMYTAKRAAVTPFCLITDAKAKKNETSGQTAVLLMASSAF